MYCLFSYVVMTTSAGIMDHEEAKRKHVGGKILGFFFWNCWMSSSVDNTLFRRWLFCIPYHMYKSILFGRGMSVVRMLLDSGRIELIGMVLKFRCCLPLVLTFIWTSCDIGYMALMWKLWVGLRSDEKFSSISLIVTFTIMMHYRSWLVILLSWRKLESMLWENIWLGMRDWLKLNFVVLIRSILTSIFETRFVL